MKSNRTSIDNFFKDNLYDANLYKKEGNWEKLHRRLYKQARKKKKKRWLLFSSCFLIILASSLFLLLFDKNEKGKINNKKQELVPALKKEAVDHQPEANIQLPNNTAPNDKNELQSIGVSKKFSKEIKINIPDNNLDLGLGYPKNILNDPDNGAYRKSNTGDSLFEILFDSANSNHIQTSIEYRDINQLHKEDSSKTNTDIGESKGQDTIPFEEYTANGDSPSILEKTNTVVDSVSKPSTQTSFLNFQIYAGINLYRSSHEFSYYENISPILGFELIHPFTSKLKIGLAGLYSNQGGYRLSDTATAVNEFYFLTKETNTSKQIIHIHQIQKLYVPVTFYYSLTKRHSLLGAIQLSYLLDTKGDFEESNTIFGLTSSTKKDHVSGYVEGIKPLGISISLGYIYSFSRRLDFTTRFNFELTEPYVSDYFYGVNTKPSWFFQTFLVVKL